MLTSHGRWWSGGFSEKAAGDKKTEAASSMEGGNAALLAAAAGFGNAPVVDPRNNSWRGSAATKAAANQVLAPLTVRAGDHPTTQRGVWRMMAAERARMFPSLMAANGDTVRSFYYARRTVRSPRKLNPLSHALRTSNQLDIF
jgi:hypothetical protein